MNNPGKTMWYMPTHNVEQVHQVYQDVFIKHLLATCSYPELESMAQTDPDENDLAEMETWGMDESTWRMCVETAMGKFDDEA